MDPYLIAELKTYIITTVAACSLVVGGLSAWLGSIWSARILRNEEARQKLRIELYRQAVDPFIKLYVSGSAGKLSTEALEAFQLTKLRVASDLTLFASQEVMDAFNGMVDYVSDVSEGKEQGTEQRTIEVASKFLNTARKDIGLGTGSIIYRGHRPLPA